MEQIQKLKELSLPDTEITQITRIENGSFAGMDGLPPFVRVQLLSVPSPVSRIHTEVWLPDDWNGIFLGTGNGGMAGGIAYSYAGAFLPGGYAVANTDMGTSGYPDRDIHSPAFWKDFGWRSTHGMAVLGKEVLRAFYGREEEHAYFVGASTGGNQALQMAQRFPEDYDGILAGVPANNRIFIHVYFVWNFINLHRADGTPMFTDAQISAVTACGVRFFQQRGDGLPGDRFITYPCQTPAVIREFLAFLASEEPQFTEEQLKALEAVYRGPVHPATGRQIYNGMPIGSEKFGGGIRDCQGQECLFFMPFLGVFGRTFSPYDFDFDDDLDRISDLLSPEMNANRADLRPFRDHGGKLLFYSGSADPCVPYPDAWRYMERVQAEMGGYAETMKFCQYYLLPGMDHGDGGDGTNVIEGADGASLLDVLRRWREQEQIPEKLLAARNENGKRVWERYVYPLGSAGFPGGGRPVVCDDFYLAK